MSQLGSLQLGTKTMTLYFKTVEKPILSSSKPESNSREQIIIVFLLRTYLLLEKHLLENILQNSSDKVILILVL